MHAAAEHAVYSYTLRVAVFAQRVLICTPSLYIAVGCRKAGVIRCQVYRVGVSGRWVLS